ncbi:MAG: homoserine kinase [Anaerolineales bacterium]|jgi:homoserine kinase|uniref:homoserine kinase n=1 Tax=Candidatus Villigracilis vicinus TaxID=3140679 RepID=UPI0031346BB8|nr:homoserine kinase [Anaerolineales bacterium]MBK7449080.1 homoserine kinase [Anaerolineales bacterium]MBK9780813.1 homoserine kinase [Anaerolineales bacterium]
MIKIRVPATSANLGPGFDCLGLALDLWNEIAFEEAKRLKYRATGEGAEKLNKGSKNLLTKSYVRLFEICGKKMPGVHVAAKNDIPMSSGLGSSAAAIMAGLYGANEMLGKPLNNMELLKLATDMEGHPDNVAPALFGGLVVSAMNGDEIILRRFELPKWTVVIVKPDVEWLTKTARAVLPKSVSRADAIFNIGRASLVVEALRTGDLELLQKVMDDRIHQPYRLQHISGGTAAYKKACQFGAAALSGAGPSIITFVPPQKAEEAKKEIARGFEELGIMAKSIITSPGILGTHRI